MKLFQYWDRPEPPAEVAQWIEGFRTRNPEFEHELFDEASAAAFISQHYGPRELAAFEACARPAMQADYIRLCLLDVHGGVYVDADNQSLEPLSDLISTAPDALMFTWLGMINNGFMMFRKPHDPFVRACLALATENVEARRFRIEFTATGPGVLNAIRALIDPASLDQILAAFDNPLASQWGFPELLEIARASITVTPELTSAYNAITLMHVLTTGRWIGAEQPAYKQTDNHWITWKGDIYR